jgi:hypothetical protein
MATQFVPINLGLIKQGDFIDECEKAFRDAQVKLIKHVEQYGRTAAAIVNAKISIKYDSEKESYAIVTDVDEKLPKAPPKVTTAFVSEDPATGQACLFGKASGTENDNPRQQLLCTQDGKTVDPETGKVKK